MQKTTPHLDASMEQDVNRAVDILTQGGCSEIFLFGSVASGMARANSDLDLAVRGCPHGQFYRLLGTLLVELQHPVDLINLDSQDRFAHFLEREGALVRIS